VGTLDRVGLPQAVGAAGWTRLTVASIMAGHVAAIFHECSGWWPMRGWRAAFAARGLVCFDGCGWRRRMRRLVADETAVARVAPVTHAQVNSLGRQDLPHTNVVRGSHAAGRRDPLTPHVAAHRRALAHSALRE
jgi:hypothetical protein